MKLNRNVYKEYKDMFNIYQIITKINKGYRLYFNLNNKKFYILNTNRNNEICLMFDNFSRNILKDLQFSKIENLNINLKFIDEFNEKLYEKNIKNLKQISSDKIKETHHNIVRSKII